MRRALLACACAATWGAVGAAAATTLAWDCPRAGRRQVVEVAAARPRPEPAFAFECAAPETEALRVVDAAEPAEALPVFRDGRRVTVRMRRTLEATAHVITYWSGLGARDASPALDAAPVSNDDYASATYGDAWDFDEGDQDGIQHWGDGPAHVGEVTVRDGILTVPVTGNDPYLIWGRMWGGAARPERIDTGLYTRLRMRVRQSRPRAGWTLYVTDTKGAYESHPFAVEGTEFRTLEFDLVDIFRRSWDGREMRALRIDTTNNSPGTTVQIDWVRLEREPLEAEVGPVMERAEVEARGRVGRLEVEAPASARAGEAPAFGVRGACARGVALVCELHDREGRLVSRATTLVTGGAAGAVTTLKSDVGPRAGDLTWTVGVADDMGRPGLVPVSGAMSVISAGLDRYVLTPASRFVAAGARNVRVEARGADRFGNDVPALDARARVSVQGGRAHDLALAGGTLRFEVDCSEVPLTTHAVRLADSRGVAGECGILTVGFRKSRIAIGPGGYLTLDGAPYLPLGGFYANWPSRPADGAGRVPRALDLFPCGPSRYAQGSPWPAPTERAVVEYLDMCRANGVTGLRLMLRNMDLVGRVDRVQLAATLHLFDLARERGIRFNVALLEDYDKPPYVSARNLGEIVLPHYTEDELAALPPHRARFLVERRVLASPGNRYVDADAIRCQKDYLDELIPVLAGREEVFCYEFENEMVHPPMSWCREIAAHIRSIDPRTPVLGNPGPHDWPVPLVWRDAGVDLFSYHPYAWGRRGADQGAEAYTRGKWAAAAGVPFFPGEGGMNSSTGARIADAFAMRASRDHIWMSLACGAAGAFLWTPEFASEVTEFGKVALALEVLKLELSTFRRRRPRTAVVMPDDGSANGAAMVLSARLLARGVDFDVRLAGDCAGYAVRVGATGELADGVRAEFFEPAEGWDLSSLVSTDGRALVYLRNVAGPVNTDVVRQGGSAHLRTPAPAAPAIRIRGGRWQTVRAFDLDDAREVRAAIRRGEVRLGPATAHDFVLAFRGDAGAR